MNFGKPASILNPVIKLIREKEVQEKLQKMRENFNINKYLEKEKEEGVNIDFLGRRRSYLDFLQYTEKGHNFKDFLEENGNNINFNENNGNKHRKSKIHESNNNLNISDNKSKLEDIIEDKFKDNVSFLSSDSNLTVDKNISLGDINLLPKDIKEMAIFVNSSTTKESIKKKCSSQ